MSFLRLCRSLGLRISSAACNQSFPTRRFSDNCISYSTVDPRVKHSSRLIESDYASIRESYQTPKNPIVLAHGLLGFDELQIAGSFLPGIQYWRGVKEALNANGIEVITASVSASGSIEKRAEMLAHSIESKSRGRNVNIIAGLDSRLMLSQLRPTSFDVLSLTTIATPHRGSSFADFVFEQIGPETLPTVYKVAEQLGLETGAFSQLTRRFMREDFNPKNPDNPNVRYYSFGACCDPHFLSFFRQSHGIIEGEEGPNDGLVSVESSNWGSYKGTLDGVSHLDLINWTNRLRWFLWRIRGKKRNFNAIAFYLAISDMLAKEGL